MAVTQVIVEKQLLTYAPIKEYQCTWTCKFVRDRVYKVGESVDSPQFMTGEYKWDIEVYFSGFSSDDKDYVNARLFLHHTIGNTNEYRRFTSSFKAATKLSIIDKNNKEHVKQSLTRAKENLPEHCFRVKRDDLLSSLDLLPNDELTLMCRISLYSDARQAIHSEIVDSPRSKSQCQSEQKLIERLKLENLYKTLQLVDQFGVTKLKSVVIRFIVQNSKTLSTMEEFKKSIETLSSSTLAQVVCALLAK